MRITTQRTLAHERLRDALKRLHNWVGTDPVLAMLRPARCVSDMDTAQATVLAARVERQVDDIVVHERLILGEQPVVEPLQLVGITGRKRHGKDTVSGFFVERGFARMRFADPLKRMLSQFYVMVGCGVDDIMGMIDGDLKEVPSPHLAGKTPRHAMQTLGTEWGRVCLGEDIWVNALLSRAQLRGGKIVVSDVRFPNECAAIRRAGGRVYRVDAGARVTANEFSAHPSEVAVDTLEVDGVIRNDSDLFALREEVRNVCFADEFSTAGVNPTSSCNGAHA